LQHRDGSPVAKAAASNEYRYLCFFTEEMKLPERKGKLYFNLLMNNKDFKVFMT